MLDKTFGEDVMGGLAIISSTLHQDGSIEHFGNLRQNITFGNRDNKKNDILLPFYEFAKNQNSMLLLVSKFIQIYGRSGFYINGSNDNIIWL